MSSEVERLVKQVKSLPAEQQEQFRDLLEADNSKSTARTAEDEFKQRCLKSGLMREIKPGPNAGSTSRQRVEIQGKPLSETVIEERR